MMIKKIFLLPFLFFFKPAISQHAWDIGYIERDSITTKQIGKEVHLDFKNQQNKVKESYRFTISIKDTGVIAINKENIEMVEIRKIYPDWGLFKEQYLESVKEFKRGVKLRIINSVIKQVNKDSILILAKGEFRNIKRKKSVLVETITYDIWIEKFKLEGLIYKEH